MNKIKLVHFTSSLKMGGAEKVLFDLVSSLDHTIYEQVVIFIHDGPYRKQFEHLGIPTYSVRGLFLRYDPWIVIRVWRLLRILKPDLLHSLLWSANLIGRIVARYMGIPCVRALHNNCMQDGFVRNSIDKLIRGAHNPVIAVSQEVAQSAITQAWVPAHSIQVISNGIACNTHYQSNITRAMLGLSDEHFIIGSVGRFHSVKRYDLLLKIYAQIQLKYSQTRLLLLGVGELEQELRRLASRLKIAHLVTFIIGQPAQNYYHLFDCFVQTSAQEGVSIALLEAMSAGVPCIGMYSGVSHTIIESGKSGITVHADDFKGLIEVIEKLIKNPQLRTELSHNAQVHVHEKFSLQKMVQSYDKLFNSMIFMQK